MGVKTKQAPKAPRWQHRFDSFRRAFLLLREAVDQMDERGLTQLEKEGMIQRFEYTWELAWKLLKDMLEAEGVVLSTVTPARVIRAAATAKLIERGDVWLEALDARNALSHTYSLKTFELTIKAIRLKYLGVLDGLHFKILGQLAYAAKRKR